MSPEVATEDPHRGQKDEDSDRPEDDPEAIALRGRLREHLEAMTTTPRARGSQGGNVTAAAGIMSRLLLDGGSLNFYRKLCWRVVKEEIPAAMVLAAFDAVYDQVGRRAIDNPGAYFVGTFRKMEEDRSWQEEVEPELRERARLALQAILAAGRKAG